jgi:polar amino acid transport system ATP-binding protein
VIRLTGIQKRFGSNAVLRGISLQVEKGSVTALIGPSGSGKSTLLRCMNLLEIPDAGEIEMGEWSFRFGAGSASLPADRVQSSFRSQTGMVFQHFNLFPHMTALGNVIEGLVTVKGMARQQAEAIGHDMLKRVGLQDRAAEMPARLSGGQKQRVAIARALAMSPQVLLLDEITSALDPELVDDVLEVIRALAREGMTMVIVTHEMAFAQEVASQVVFMADGNVVESATAHDMFTAPREERTRQFLARFKRSGALS